MIDLVPRQLRRLERPGTRGDRALHQRRDHAFKFITGYRPAVDAPRSHLNLDVGLFRVAEAYFDVFRKRAQLLANRGGFDIHLKLRFNFPDEQIAERLVKIIAPQVRVAVGGEHFKDAVLQAQDRNVKRAAAQVIDRNGGMGAAIQPIRERGRGGLIDDPHHVPTRDFAGITRGLSLRVVELRGDGDYRAADLMPEVPLRAQFQFPQNHGANLRRGETMVTDGDRGDIARGVAI